MLLANWIALLVTHRDNKIPFFSDTVRTSCLPKLNEGNLVGEKATVTGWGKPSDDSNSKSPVLRYYKGVPIIDNDTCQRYYGSTINAGSICIDTTGSHGVCNVSM